MRRFDENVRTLNRAWLIVLAEHLGVKCPNDLQRVALRRINENMEILVTTPENMNDKGKFCFKKAKENLFTNSSHSELGALATSIGNFGAAARNRGSLMMATAKSNRADKNVRIVNKAWLLIMAEHLGVSSLSDWREKASRRIGDNLALMARDVRNLDEWGNFSFAKAKQNLFKDSTEQEIEQLCTSVDKFGKHINKNLDKTKCDRVK